MRYSCSIPGIFLSRPNRFIARVLLNGREEICHVKNTGRCRELLIPGVTVWCCPGTNPSRKTKYDLIAVEKGPLLINMDSQAPNAVAKAWLQAGGLGPLEDLRAETVHGDSRFDFSFTRQGIPCFLEVKGCTLEQEGICAFPDAPTTRGTKHLRGLIQARQEGFGAYVLFVIQMTGPREFRPHDRQDPDFGRALRDAAQAGVEILAMDCTVTPDSLAIGKPVPVRL